MAENIDIVNHPPHYKAANGVETIDVIEGFTDPISSSIFAGGKTRTVLRI